MESPFLGAGRVGAVAIPAALMTCRLLLVLAIGRSCVALGCNGPSTFDTGMQGWTQSKTDMFDWTRKDNSTSSDGTGPTSDHTTGTGYYLYIEASSPRESGDTATIYSPYYNAPFSTACQMRFWYHMYGSSIGSLTLKALYGSSSSRTLFKASGNKGNLWNSYVVNLSPMTIPSRFRLSFTAVRGSSYRGDIAIDDISFTSACCPRCNRPSTFDTGMQGWTQSKTDQFDWVRKGNSTSSSYTGPTSDHTTGSGYYLYIETSFHANGDTATIYSPYYNAPLSIACQMQFWYHMYGNSIGSLTVKALYGSSTNRTLFKASGNKGNLWNSYVVNLSPTTITSRFRLSFTAVRGSSYTGDIAIDDISFSSACCSLVNCLELTAPENGAMTVGSDQRTATFTCNSGYLLQGTDTRFCGVNGIWNGTTATCSEPDSPLQCASNSMSYALDKSIAPPTLYEIPHLLNDTCLAVDNSTQYIFNFGYDDCGTEIVHFQGELYYSNIINAKALHTLPDTLKDPESQIITSLLTIRLQCKFNKEVAVTTYEANYGYIVPISQNPIFNVTGIGLFSSSMNVFTDKAFSENMKKGTTHVYRLNQRAYFEIHITNDRRLSVRAQECWVNVGKYDTFPKAFVLRNGCPIKGNVAALISHSSLGSNTHRLSYQVFGINGYEDRIQYFHCTARVCSADDSAAFCNKGCESGARRRRQAPANTNVVEASDRNPYFTFSTPGFFVAPSPDADVLPTTTPKTSGGGGSRSLIIMPAQNILFIMISSCLAYLLCTI